MVLGDAEHHRLGEQSGGPFRLCARNRIHRHARRVGRSRGDVWRAGERRGPDVSRSKSEFHDGMAAGRGLGAAQGLQRPAGPASPAPRGALLRRHLQLLRRQRASSGLRGPSRWPAPRAALRLLQSVQLRELLLLLDSRCGDASAHQIRRHLPVRLKKQPAGTDQQSRSPVNGVGLCVQDPALPLSCTVRKSQFWSSYRVNVTEVNPLGSTFSLLDITVQTITKPDPPEELRVEPVPLAPKRLRVSWEYPSTWPKEPSFQLRFRLRYRPVLYDSWSVVETAKESEVITDAFMGLEHVVQVSARDFLDAGSWSEWTPEARGWPAAGQIDEPSEAATATTDLEMPAEEPSPSPKDEPVGHSDSMEKVAVLVSLGVFAFFVLAAFLLFALLVWIRAKKLNKEADKNCDLLAAATHLKALPRAQLL
ncbi:interleukin-11 receptor subunit alpha isoform 3-T5 [Liasis olivaceus]